MENYPTDDPKVVRALSRIAVEQGNSPSTVSMKLEIALQSAMAGGEAGGTFYLVKLSDGQLDWTTDLDPKDAANLLTVPWSA